MVYKMLGDSDWHVGGKSHLFYNKTKVVFLTLIYIADVFPDKTNCADNLALETVVCLLCFSLDFYCHVSAQLVSLI